MATQFPEKPTAHPNYQKSIGYNPDEIEIIALSNGTEFEVLKGSFHEEWVSTKGGSIQLFKCIDRVDPTLTVVGQSQHIIAMWTREAVDTSRDKV